MQYAFFFHSKKENNLLNRIVNTWNEEDEEQIREMLEEGDVHEYEIVFEYPYLIRLSKIIKANG